MQLIRFIDRHFDSLLGDKNIAERLEPLRKFAKESAHKKQLNDSAHAMGDLFEGMAHIVNAVSMYNKEMEPFSSLLNEVAEQGCQCPDFKKRRAAMDSDSQSFPV